MNGSSGSCGTIIPKCLIFVPSESQKKRRKRVVLKKGLKKTWLKLLKTGRYKLSDSKVSANTRQNKLKEIYAQRHYQTAECWRQTQKSWKQTDFNEILPKKTMIDMTADFSSEIMEDRKKNNIFWVLKEKNCHLVNLISSDN